MSDASSHAADWRPATHYPDPAIHALDARKEGVPLAALQRTFGREGVQQVPGAIPIATPRERALPSTGVAPVAIVRAVAVNDILVGRAVQVVLVVVLFLV